MIIKLTQRILYISAFILLLAIGGCSKKNTKLPILIIATNADFGSYTGELLKTEGFNEFLLDSLSDSKVTSEYLQQFDLVILAEAKIDQSGKDMLTEFVVNGGNMIAFRPDTVLADIFGMSLLEGTISEGYIAIDTSSEQGKGLPPKTLQFHGTADKYTVNSAKIIATLFANQTSIIGFPGIVCNDFGKGHAVAFLYNLPKSIVYTRQGNPLFAGIEKDGIPGIRSLDLFADSWVDASKNTINQADQQMALLSKCIHYLSTYSKPLPHFWYFPDTLKCLITLTNDGEFNCETEFEPQFHDVDSMGAKMTLYILDVNKISKVWVDKWTAKGHEFAGHPDDTWEAENPVWNNMDSVLQRKKNEIHAKYGLTMRTNVNHWFVWCGKDSTKKQDFGAQAMLEEKNGIELDVNYPLYDINSNQGAFYLGTPGLNQGFHTGSGLVMKYANVKGKTINVYQHFNAVYDQQYKESNNPEGFFNCFKGLVDRSLDKEIYSFISIKAHNDEYFFSKKPLLKMLAYANSKGIPVWTAVNLLDFLKMKDEASFSEFKWSNNHLTFKLSSTLKNPNKLTFLLPLDHGDSKIKSININGKSRLLKYRKIKGSEYVLVTVTPGNTYEISAEYM